MPWAGTGVRCPLTLASGPQRTEDHEHRDLPRAGPDPRVSPGWRTPVGVSPAGPWPAGVGLSGDLAGRARPPRSRAPPPSQGGAPRAPLAASRLGATRPAAPLARRTPPT